MLPTPDTSHVPYARVYEPSEDSFLLLDTLSSPTEVQFLTTRFSHPPPNHPVAPLLLEIGPGSGVLTSFLTAHSLPIFGTSSLLTLAIDINPHACRATNTTVSRAVSSATTPPAFFLDSVQGDLTTPMRQKSVDIMVFNPPYVPTETVPGDMKEELSKFEEDSHFLELSYAGGKDGMEITERLIGLMPGVLTEGGVGYVLLCAQNKPEEVKERMRRVFGDGWRVETVGRSGKQAGWEKLEVVRVWREDV